MVRNPNTQVYAGIEIIKRLLIEGNDDKLDIVTLTCKELNASRSAVRRMMREYRLQITSELKILSSGYKGVDGNNDLLPEKYKACHAKTCERGHGKFHYDPHGCTYIMAQKMDNGLNRVKTCGDLPLGDHLDATWLLMGRV